MNLFDLPPLNPDQEIYEDLIPDKGIHIERIISAGQASPPGFWYEQNRDEWVVLLQGQAVMAWGDGYSQFMEPGDWLLIPAGERHRVEWTSQEPPCIWLAVHGKLT